MNVVNMFFFKFLSLLNEQDLEIGLLRGRQELLRDLKFFCEQQSRVKQPFRKSTFAYVLFFGIAYKFWQIRSMKQVLFCFVLLNKMLFHKDNFY